MSQKKKNNPDGYVLKADCSEMMRHGDEQFREIKKALVGEEFGKIGGIVKDMADIKTQLDTVTSQMSAQARAHWISRREKILILVAIISVFGSVLTALISAFAH